MNVLRNLISERLTIPVTSTKEPKDEEVATILFENVQSISNCTSYSFEDKKILYHDFNIEFSLEYMENVVQFYDERNPKIRKQNNIRKDKFQSKIETNDKFSIRVRFDSIRFV